ncbi:MAG: DinB family protein [Chitinophagales bacterium]
MKRSDIKQLPSYFSAYINLVEDIELKNALEKSVEQINSIDITLLEKIGLKTYAEGKWSTHKIIQHIIDWERIWCYRTLLFVRNEGTIPSGHNENLMADNCNADELPISQLIDELRIVRMSTLAFFNSLSEQHYAINCQFINYEMSVLAMGFNIIGHQLHHFNVIQERYVPLAS